MDNNINTNIKVNNPIIDNNVRDVVTPKVNIIDPKRVNDVTKHDGQNNLDKENLARNPESVQNKFINELKNTPDMLESAKKIIMSNQFVASNIKTDKEMEVVFNEFIKTLEMTKEEAVDLIRFQDGASSKFSGDFFSELRLLLNTGENKEEFSGIIRDLLSAYDSFTSTEVIEKSIWNSLNNIERSLPELLKETFTSMTNSMDGKVDMGVIKGEIIPFIANYIATMNDFGKVRDYVSQLFHNIVRLENGEQANLQRQFDKLVDFIVYNFNYNDNDVERLVSLFNETYMNHEKEGNKQIEAFFRLINIGLGEGKKESTGSIMSELVESLIINQSPHVPLAYMFIPMQLDGKTIISEMWVDKEYEEYTEDRKDSKKGEYKYKAYVTFDIQGLGYFETTINMLEGKIDIDLRVPKKISEHINKIERDIKHIIENNNMNITGLTVSSVKNKRGFEEIFTNILERGKGINVTI